MKRNNPLILFILALLILAICSPSAEAQSKIIRKTIKKVVTPQIAPAQPPNTDASAESTVDEPVPPPPEFNTKNPKENRGIFGWGINTDLSGKFLTGNGSLLGLRGNIIFSDPLSIGERIGLAEDAVEFKTGLGVGFGNNFTTVPLFADTVIYLKENSLFGMDPYLGAGLIYNLFGTASGGLGGQLYFGILADFGFEAGKTGFALGYGNYKVADKYSADGIFFAVTQPFTL